MRSVLAFSWLFFATVFGAQAGSLEIMPPDGNWNKLKNLPPGSEIEIKLGDGEKIDGRFLNLMEDSILYEEFGREKACPNPTSATGGV
jgi:hypothetical protein